MSKYLSLLVTALLLSIAVVGWAAPAAETKTVGAKKQINFPTKPIQLIVPSGAGAGTDIMSRALASAMKMNQPVVVVNKPGASGTLGTSEVALAKPDGYTVIAGMPAPFYIQPHILDLAYSIEDFRHIAQISPEEPLVLVVRPESPIKTLKQFEEMLKAGTTVKYGSAQPGSVGHLGMVDMFTQMKVKGGEHVPFQGAAAALTALLGGHIDIMPADLAEVLPRIRDKQLRPLAVFAMARNAALPDVPTFKEIGYNDIICVAFKWVAVPKNTPSEVVDYLKEEINKAVMSDSYKAYIKELNGLEVVVRSEEELTKNLKKFREQYGQTMASIGMKKK